VRTDVLLCDTSACVSMLMVSGRNTSGAFFRHVKPRCDVPQPQAATEYI